MPYRGSNDVPPHPDEYAGVVKAALGDLGAKIYLEPGRMIVGNAGILVTRVIYVKHGAGRVFTIVDGAMNDLIRPTLYEAYHEVWPVAEARGREPSVMQDVVGPVCETGDYLAVERELPPFRTGDLMAVMTAGAYGAVMSSTYNTAPAGAGGAGQRRSIRRRPSQAELRRSHRRRSPTVLDRKPLSFSKPASKAMFSTLALCNAGAETAMVGLPNGQKG